MKIPYKILSIDQFKGVLIAEIEYFIDNSSYKIVLSDNRVSNKEALINLIEKTGLQLQRHIDVLTDHFFVNFENPSLVKTLALDINVSKEIDTELRKL